MEKVRAKVKDKAKDPEMDLVGDCPTVWTITVVGAKKLIKE
jgi:hypothetical protein